MPEHISSLDHSGARSRNIEGSGLKSALPRYFFCGMALLFLFIASVGFIPSYQDNIAGTFPIHWVAHIHGAIMLTWLLVGLTQTLFVARRALKLHIALGTASVVLALLVVISGCVADFRFLAAGRFPVEDFQYDILWAVFSLSIEFALFYSLGFVNRRRNPGAHKRFMIFATLILMQPAIDRMHWLPGLYGAFYYRYVYIDSLLLPILFFDLLTLGRIHKATALSVLTLLAVQGATLLILGSPTWHGFWFNYFNPPH